MAIKYYCDRCGAEMQSSSIVTMTESAPVISRSRPPGSPVELCDTCGAEVRAVLGTKITRPDFTPHIDELERLAKEAQEIVTQAAKPPVKKRTLRGRRRRS